MAHVNKKNYNRPIRAAFCASLFIFMACSSLYAASMNLVWNSNTESDLAGYRIYYGTSSGNYTSSQETGRVTRYTLSNLTEGRTYYIAMSAFDTARNESRRSAEIRGLASDDEQRVYEDAEDGMTDRWSVYDFLPAVAEIAIVYDGDRLSDVIQLTGAGVNNGYRLSTNDGARWHNETHKVIQWSMKYDEAFTVYIDLETTAGHRYLQYNPININMLGLGEYVYFGLGTDSRDGQWHTYARDLQADLNLAQPGVTILEVNGFLIRGSGMVDDIIMLSNLPDTTIYEDAEDGMIARWNVYDDLPAEAGIENVYDSDRQSNVIEFTGYGMDNGFRLSNTDGSKWHNSTQSVIEWSINYAEFFVVYIDLETTAGHRYLTYRPLDNDQLGSGEYVFFGLGTDVMDGEWHTFVRDLQAGLNEAQPGVIILEVNGFLIRGSGMVDDIKLHN